MKKYRFLFTGGGTGGHVYPNVAIYEALKEKHPDAEFLYVGTRRGSEASIIPALAQPMEYAAVPSRGLPQGLRSPRTLAALAVILLGAVKSWFILRRFKPDVIIGSGGYASAPVLLAAALLKKKVFIHEQNAVPGRLNLFVARFAARIGVTFPSSAAFFQEGKVIETGYPLRRSIRGAGNAGLRDKFNIPPDSRVLFICSGSMGARTINRAAAEIIPRLVGLPNLFVILSTGKAYGASYRAYDDTVGILEHRGYAPEIEGRLLVREYFDQIAEIYDMADLVVSRAGAGAIQEITAKGLPAILVPKIDLPGDHQVLNAREVEKAGGARVLYEEMGGGRRRNEIFLPPEALFGAVEELLADRERLAAMRRNLLAREKPDSTAIILAAIDELTGNGAPAREREIRTHYLQAVEEEKNLELPFPATIVGSSALADVRLEGLEDPARFTVRLLDDSDPPALARRQRGRVLLNGGGMSGWMPLRPGDRLTVSGRDYIFKSHAEKAADGNPAGDGPPRRTWPFVARLAELGRAVAAAALFGAGRAVDVFAAALAAAEFLRRLVGSEAMGRSFLPLFGRLFQRGPRRKAWEAAATLTLGTLGLSLLIAVAGALLASPLARLLFPGLAQAGAAPSAAAMSRILFAGIFLGGVSAILMTLLRAFGRLNAANASLLLFAAGAVGGIFLFLPASGPFSLAWAVLFGSLLQILFLAPFAAGTLSRPGLEFSFRPSFRANRQATRKFAAQLAPAGLGASLRQAPLLVERFAASLLVSGSISYLYFAMELLLLPLALASRAVQRATRRDGAPGTWLDRERTRRLLVEGLRNTLFLMAPLSILLIALANPVVALLLERSHFSAAAVGRTALALQFYAIGLTGWGIHALTGRIFTARLEERTATFLDLALLAVQVPLVAWLARTPLGFAGIALATSIAVSAAALLRVAVVQARLRREGAAPAAGEMISSAGKTLSACLLMVIAIIEAKFVFNRIQFSSRTLENAIFCVSLTFMGTAVYFLSSLLLKNTGILMFRKRNPGAGGALPVSLLPPSRFLDAVAANPDYFKAEYRYKTSIYLSSPSWEVRNVGIKLIGLFKDRSKVPFLVEMLSAGRGNGFMRRNALQALRAVNPWSEEIKALVLRLLNDGYFEVRAAALDYLAQNLSEGEYAGLRPRLLRRLARGRSDERIACLRLVARKGGLDDLPRLRRLYLHRSSLLREEVLELLYTFHRRGLLGGEEVKREVQQVLVTSNHLTPEFRIKSIIQRIVREADHP